MLSRLIQTRQDNTMSLRIYLNNYCLAKFEVKSVSHAEIVFNIYKCKLKEFLK
jgi:hypothetical protein